MLAYPGCPGKRSLNGCSSSSCCCCHSNATRAPIANLPNSARLEGTPYHCPNLHPGPCSSVGIRPRTDRHADRRGWLIYISRRLRLRRNAISLKSKITNAETNCSFSDAELSQQYEVSRWFLVTHARNAPFLSSNSHHATEESFWMWTTVPVHKKTKE